MLNIKRKWLYSLLFLALFEMALVKQSSALTGTTSYMTPVPILAGGAPVNLGNHATPHAVDWDSDNDLDLLVGGGDGYIWLFRNSGTALVPMFDLGIKVQSGGEDLREGLIIANACFEDMNGDGLRDLIIGSYPRRLCMYVNNGTSADPQFADSVAFPGPGGDFVPPELSAGRVDVADWNGDGLKDLMFGDFLGYITFYRNTGTETSPRFDAPGVPLMLNGNVINWAYNIHPRVFDINQDGIPDLAYGINWGYIGFLMGEETSGTLNFQHHHIPTDPNGSSLNIDGIVAGNTVPEFMDMNNDGVLDMISGGENGKLVVMYGISYMTILDKIQDLMEIHSATLGADLKTSEALRKDLFGLHHNMRRFTLDFLISPIATQPISDWYEGHISDFPQYFHKQYLDPKVHTYVPYLAGQVWVNFFESLPDTPSRRESYADLIGLEGRYRDILFQLGTHFIENSCSDLPQQDVVYNYLSLIPHSMWDCEIITAIDFLGSNPPSEVHIERKSGPNIFSFRVGASTGNGFPADSLPSPVDTFSICLAHEVNHGVDARACADMEFMRRKSALIEACAPPDVIFLHREPITGWWDVGVDWQSTKNRFQDLGYWNGIEANWASSWSAYWLKSDILPYNNNWLRDNLQLMCEAPQEAFATLSNQYFADGEIMFDLCLRRWDKGMKTCINQFLFFADIYSQGKPWTYLYRSDEMGNFWRWIVPLARNEEKYINRIFIGGHDYIFDVNDLGFVTAIYEDPTTGSLQLTIEPEDAVEAGAGWRRIGTSTWRNSGAMETNIPVGSHTVEFKDVPGWIKPPNLDVTITDGETTSTTAFYDIIHTVTFITDGTPGTSLDGATTQTVHHHKASGLVMAVAIKGWYFFKWTRDGSNYSTSNPLIVTNVTEDMTLIANFISSEELKQKILDFILGRSSDDFGMDRNGSLDIDISDLITILIQDN